MKRHAWKIVAGVALLLAATFGAAWWGLQRRATAVFERQDARARELMAGLRSRSWPRPVLFGPAIPGDGWNDYAQALAAFAAIPDAEADELRTIQTEPNFEPDLEAIEEFFEKYAPLVEQLRTSQRRAGFTPQYQYEAGSFVPLPTVTQAIRTARILSARATHFYDSGRRAEALDSLAMGIGVGHDTARGGVTVNLMVRQVCEGIEAWALREILEDHEFKPKELERFAGQLDRLLETRPAVGPAVDAEEACTINSLVGTGLRGAPLAVALRAGDHVRNWRYLYSERLACAGALGDLARMYEAMRSSSVLDSHLRGPASLKAMDGVKLDRNPITASMSFSADRFYRRDSIALLELTMMRVAVALARFDLDQGDMPARLDDLVPRYLPKVPLCPLTGLPLLYKDGKVWSVGENRVDDGGVSGRDAATDAADGDYVWKVSRRRK